MKKLRANYIRGMPLSITLFLPSFFLKTYILTLKQAEIQFGLLFYTVEGSYNSRKRTKIG